MSLLRPMLPGFTAIGSGIVDPVDPGSEIPLYLFKFDMPAPYVDYMGNRVNAIGSDSRITAAKKFGAGSMRLINSSLQVVDVSKFNPNNNFNIDYWSYVYSSNVNQTCEFLWLGNLDGYTRDFMLRFYNNTFSISYRTSSGEVTKYLDMSQSVDTFSHWNLERIGSNIVLYKNGIPVDSVNIGSDIILLGETNRLHVGRSASTASGSGFIYIDEVRITQAALYSNTSFTVPTSEYLYNVESTPMETPNIKLDFTGGSVVSSGLISPTQSSTNNTNFVEYNGGYMLQSAANSGHRTFTFPSITLGGATSFCLKSDVILANSSPILWDFGTNNLAVRVGGGVDTNLIFYNTGNTTSPSIISTQHNGYAAGQKLNITVSYDAEDNVSRMFHDGRTVGVSHGVSQFNTAVLCLMNYGADKLYSANGLGMLNFELHVGTPVHKGPFII